MNIIRWEPLMTPIVPRHARPVLTLKQRREPKLTRPDIARMAEAEAARRAEERRDMIAIAAYFLAQKRGFEPGHELEDWLAAEAEVMRARRASLSESGADNF